MCVNTVPAKYYENTIKKISLDYFSYFGNDQNTLMSQRKMQN